MNSTSSHTKDRRASDGNTSADLSDGNSHSSDLSLHLNLESPFELEQYLTEDNDISRDNVEAISLRDWIPLHGIGEVTSWDVQPQDQTVLMTMLLRKLNVAYAIGKTLQHCKNAYEKPLKADNYNIYINMESELGWEVMGVDSGSCNATLIKLPTSNLWGRDVEVRIESGREQELDTRSNSEANENELCYAFGVLLHYIFSGDVYKCKTDGAYTDQELDANEDVEKDFLTVLASKEGTDENSFKSKSMPSQRGGQGPSTKSNNHRSTSFPPLRTYGCPSAVSQLVQNLLDYRCENDALICSDDSYPSLESALEDVHRLLREPHVFLFELQVQNNILMFNDTLYGRTKQSTELTEAFNRVVSRGRSEAFMIGGFSGCGKTRLAHSICGSVIAAGGLLLLRKIDETVNNPLTLVLSAFNDLCLFIAQKNSEEENQRIYEQLCAEFGANLHSLVCTLPNVMKLSTVNSFHCPANMGEVAVNFFSLCDNVKRFMRVVSSPSVPVVLVLDDLQWADPVSLGLVHTVLSDRPGESCMFFVGSYRDNEIKPGHIVFGFMKMLAQFDVPLHNIHLDGIPREGVTSLISDALRMFPRLCKSLSEVVYKKTSGNPFFVQRFLQSLVGKNILRYSLRQKCWTWDCHEIHTQEVTPNVLDIISSDMIKLPTRVQTALKVASCFGTTISVHIADDLSSTDQYSGLVTDLNQAVQDGFIELDADKANYQFGHDKIREAAYDMINSDLKNKYHFDIGVALLSLEGKRHEILPDIVEQINYGVPSLVHDESQRILIANLNSEAGLKSMQSYNYPSAYTYMKAAKDLLPGDCFDRHYDLSLEVNFQLAKAAYAYGNIEEARTALNEIINYDGTQFDTLLNSYGLLQTVLYSSMKKKDMDQMLVAIVKMLKSRGEDILLGNVAPGYIATQVMAAKKSFGNTTNEILFNMHKTVSTRNAIIMKGYYILVCLAYVCQPVLYPYYTAKWAQFCLKSKVDCEYVPHLYVTFAAVLCEDTRNDDFQLGARIGKLGLRLFNEYYATNQCHLPYLYLMHYGFVATLFEPLQAINAMHEKACEVALQLGDKSMVANHKYFWITRQLHAGTNLNVLKKELESDLRMTKQHSWPVLGMRLSLHLKVVSLLIGDEPTSDIETDDTAFNHDLQSLFGQIIASTYLGYFDRVKHLAEKYLSLNNDHKKKVSLRNVYFSFYYGLALLVTRRKKNYVNNVPAEVDEMLQSVTNAANLSEWNYRNKVHLMLAEKLSTICSMAPKPHSRKEYIQAAEEYKAAIDLSKSSKFVHEEGLSCELAAMHYERHKEISKAIVLFQQAEMCYKDWGSARKASKMAEKVQQLASRSSKHCHVGGT